MVLGAGGEVLGDPPRARSHLRREGYVEYDGVQVHAGPRVEHERRLRARHDLLRARLVVGDGPPLGDRDDPHELRGPATGLVGYFGYLAVDLHRVHNERRDESPVLLAQHFRQGVGYFTLPARRRPTHHEGLLLGLFRQAIGSPAYRTCGPAASILTLT